MPSSPWSTTTTSPTPGERRARVDDVADDVGAAVGDDHDVEPGAHADHLVATAALVAPEVAGHRPRRGASPRAVASPLNARRGGWSHRASRDLHDPAARAADPQAEVDVFGTEGGGVVEPVDGVERVTSEHLAGTDGEVDVGDLVAPLPGRALVDVGPVQRPRDLAAERGRPPGRRLGRLAVNTGAARPTVASSTSGATSAARVSGMQPGVAVEEAHEVGASPDARPWLRPPPTPQVLLVAQEPHPARRRRRPAAPTRCRRRSTRSTPSCASADATAASSSAPSFQVRITTSTFTRPPGRVNRRRGRDPPRVRSPSAAADDGEGHVTTASAAAVRSRTTAPATAMANARPTRIRPSREAEHQTGSPGAAPRSPARQPLPAARSSRSVRSTGARSPAA